MPGIFGSFHSARVTLAFVFETTSLLLYIPQEVQTTWESFGSPQLLHVMSCGASNLMDALLVLLRALLCLLFGSAAIFSP